MPHLLPLAILAGAIFFAVLAADRLAGRGRAGSAGAPAVTVVLLAGCDEAPEVALRRVLACRRRDPCGIGTVYLLRDHAAPETLAAAEIFCREHAGFVLTDREELCASFGGAVCKAVDFVLY